MRFVGASRIVPAQPRRVVCRPLTEVIKGGSGEGVWTLPLAQKKEIVVQSSNEFGLLHPSDIRLNEDSHNETDHQRGMSRTKQAPCRMILTQIFECRIIERHELPIDCIAALPLFDRSPLNITHFNLSGTASKI